MRKVLILRWQELLLLICLILLYGQMNGQVSNNTPTKVKEASTLFHSCVGVNSK